MARKNYVCHSCGEQHYTADCTFPSMLHRCSSCFTTTFDGKDHPVCNPVSTINSSRQNVYSVRSVTLFEMKLSDSSNSFNIFNIETKHFDDVEDGVKFSAGTEGMFKFATTYSGKQLLNYSAVSMKTFSILVAVFIEKQWRFRLRILVTENKGLVCFPMNSIVEKFIMSHDNRYSVPIIVGVDSISEKFTLKFKVHASANGEIIHTAESFNGYISEVNWIRKVGDLNKDAIIINGELIFGKAELRMFNRMLYKNEAAITKCYNCDGLHNTAGCTFPNFFQRCPYCLVVSFDGKDHLPPCKPLDSISSFRPNVYAIQPVELFTINVVKSSNWFNIFDFETKHFDVVKGNIKYLSAVTEGIFEFTMNDNGERLLRYSGVSMKRFSILVAVFVAKQWRFRLRILVTEDRGLLCFPMRTTFDSIDGKFIIPHGCEYNTPIIVGIGSTSDQFKLKFKVSASPNGKIIDTTNFFNGYISEVNWIREIDEFKNDGVVISEELARETAKRRKFDHKLYEVVGVKKVFKIGDLEKANEKKFYDDMKEAIQCSKNIR